MLLSPTVFLPFLACLSPASTSLAAAKYEHSNKRTGTFQSPAVEVRPKFRYWLPDASVDPAGIASDIKSIGSIGAGGIELCNYYLYGGNIGLPATDWSVYGFGTPAYNKILRAAAQARKDAGLLIDLAIGPESGQGVPADWDNPGLAYDLVSFNVKVPPGGRYEGKIPGYGNGTLLSVTTSAILSSANFSEPNTASGIIPNGFTNWTVSNISAESLTDVTHQVRPDGTISLRLPSNRNAQNYFVWASYYKLSSQRAAVPGPNPQNFIQNGSFAVDHFSSCGAKVTTDFLETYVLTNGVRELFRQVGKYNSVEVRSNLYWTPDVAKTFKKMHGYGIGKYAILLAVDNGLSFNSEYTDRVYSDAPDRGQGYVADYRATMSSLLNIYYEHLVKWSERYLGLEFSAQTGYGLPVDMLEIVPTVSVPEDESLNFGGSIDNYRQFVGPANLAGKKIVSNEVGAVFRANYQQTLPNLLTLVKQAYSAGNNQMVIHGATYSFEYPNTTWPGYSTFGYIFSDQHSRHHPGWENGYSEVLEFIARNNHVLQSGTPKRDIVFWSKKTREVSTGIAPIYESLDLVEAGEYIRFLCCSDFPTKTVTTGYGYEYLSPSNFKLPQAVVKGRALAPDGPEYKLLILRSDELLTSEGVSKIVQYAKQGFPIMISGGIPNQIASSTGLSAARSKLNTITSFPNVHLVPSGPLASAIASIGIQPLTKITADQPWYTYWRQLNKSKEAYVFIYNDGNSSSDGSIGFRSTKLPYFLDAWTGEQRPIANYKVRDEYTFIPLTLAPKQSIIVAFLSTRKGRTPDIHVTSGPPSVLEYSYNDFNDLTVKVPCSKGNLTISTSNGKQHRVSAKHDLNSTRLQNWILVAEKWGPPVDFNNSSASSLKTNTTYKLPTLLSWPLIPGLQNTSGVGYYYNSFAWHDTSVGAFVDFGRVVHTLHVSINGHRLPPLDVTHARMDISEYLRAGRNEIVAVVSTPMINGLRPYLDRIMTSGQAPLIADLTFLSLETEGGLVGEVVIVPYEQVIIKK